MIEKENVVCVIVGFVATLAMLSFIPHGETDTYIPQPLMAKDSLEKLFSTHPTYRLDGFDFPVGAPNAKGYYNAQGFGKNDHLGDDWNGNGGGNTDMGDPICAIGNGYVTESSQFYGGWGKVIRVAHFFDRNGARVYYESLYAHSSEMFVKRGDWIHRGDTIATIGNAEGKYYAHLHLEIRDAIGLPLGGGYGKDQRGYLDPTKTIRGMRSLK
jgi:murein DD-endopeptidase MepM/ murein hydrolase activator NlpD